MQTPQTWIWQHADWPHFRWDDARLSPFLAQARLAQGKALGAARLLDSSLNLEAVASILVEDGLTTSAIEGERSISMPCAPRSHATWACPPPACPRRRAPWTA